MTGNNDAVGIVTAEKTRSCAAFDLQGHRGARALFPENTLEGFAATLAIGVDSHRARCRALTADGVAVVTHDVVLNPDIRRAARTARGSRPPGRRCGR